LLEVQAGPAAEIAPLDAIINEPKSDTETKSEEVI
jgi:hypothetical protein